MRPFKLVLLIMLVMLCMVGSVSAIVLDGRASIGSSAVISGNITDVRIMVVGVGSGMYGFYKIMFEDGRWIVVGDDLTYGINAIANREVVSETQRFHVNHLYLERRIDGWNLVRVEVEYPAG